MATPISLTGYRPFFGLERATERLRQAVGVTAAAPRALPLRPVEITEPLSSRAFDELDLEFDAADSTCWWWMNPRGAPSFTPGILRDLSSGARLIRRNFTRSGPGGDAPVKHSVLGSRLAGVFNLGGDLERFSAWIQARDRDSLTAYAYACIDVLHDNAIGFDNGVITIALVQGDALGGGFETALSCHMIVAERGVKFGLPEILFNLFPGMGAVSLLTRRIGLAQAEKMLMSGRIYLAEELFELGVVQVLADPGDGVAATHRLIRQNLKRHGGLSAVQRALQRVSPLPYQELRDVTDIWVEAALALQPADLRKMARLSGAQDRRMSTTGEPVAKAVLGGAA